MCDILLKRQLLCFIDKGDKRLQSITFVFIVTCRVVGIYHRDNGNTFIYRLLSYCDGQIIIGVVVRKR